jgi:hypothetical protein
LGACPGGIAFVLKTIPVYDSPHHDPMALGSIAAGSNDPPRASGRAAGCSRRDDDQSSARKLEHVDLPKTDAVFLKRAA